MEEVTGSIPVGSTELIQLQRNLESVILILVQLNLQSGNGLVVVAHPDDETIWMGGTITANPQVQWTIIALTRSYDKDRAPKFKKAVKALGGSAIISDMEDFGELKYRVSIGVAKAHLIKRLKKVNYDYIFTHAENGEYGHERHRSVSSAVKLLINEKQLNTKFAYKFSYEMDKDDEFAIINKKSKYLNKLSRDIFNKKRDIINNIYGFNKNSFEYRSCGKLEAYNALI